MTTKPFRILGVQQIAIGGPDKQRLKSLWVDVFGLTVKSRFVSERENVDEDICALGTGPHAVEVDLMQPLDPDGKPAVHARWVACTDAVAMVRSVWKCPTALSCSRSLMGIPCQMFTNTLPRAPLRPVSS